MLHRWLATALTARHGGTRLRVTAAVLALALAWLPHARAALHGACRVSVPVPAAVFVAVWLVFLQRACELARKHRRGCMLGLGAGSHAGRYPHTPASPYVRCACSGRPCGYMIRVARCQLLLLLHGRWHRLSGRGGTGDQRYDAGMRPHSLRRRMHTPSGPPPTAPSGSQLLLEQG